MISDRNPLNSLDAYHHRDVFFFGAPRFAVFVFGAVFVLSVVFVFSAVLGAAFVFAFLTAFAGVPHAAAVFFAATFFLVPVPAAGRGVAPPRDAVPAALRAFFAGA